MTFVERMRQTAKKEQRKLVLPEGTEPRTIRAARIIIDEGLASQVTLVGTQDEVKKAADDVATSLEGVEVDNPDESKHLDRFVDEYVELRKHKGMTPEKARRDIGDPLKWGAMMVHTGVADGMVAGAENATADVLLAAFRIIGTKPGTNYASSCFVMAMDDPKWGAGGSFVFADCAINIEPDAEQLAEIAIASAESCTRFLQAEPIVAMLSFSTKGSASHERVEKVTSAVKIAREKNPNLVIDGELQADAALMAGVGEKKAPNSAVAGKANVLVFPDLDSGNIGYKLVQRLAGAEAYGPFLQGFAKPVSDLSRGCSVEDIVKTAAATLCQA